MTVSWLLKPSSTSILVSLLMTLLTSSCSTENSATPDHSNASDSGVINSTKKIDTNTNYAAAISGIDSGSITEDDDPDGDNLLELSGKLNITDSNIDEAAFIATTHSGNYGSLTIDAAGYWHYAADNNQSLIQDLASSDILTDSLTVSSIDGTTHAIVITINGIDEIVTVDINTIEPDTSTTEPVSEPAPEPTVSDVSLSWVAPAEREDNTGISLSEIAGYKVYYGTTQGNYSSSIDINDGSATGHTFKDFPAGTYYFVVTTRDTEGRESQYSVEVKIIV